MDSYLRLAEYMLAYRLLLSFGFAETVVRDWKDI